MDSLEQMLGNEAYQKVKDILVKLIEGVIPALEDFIKEAIKIISEFSENANAGCIDKVKYKLVKKIMPTKVYNDKIIVYHARSNC